jgi:hypothetical protein
MGVGGQHHAPAALLPGKTRYPLYRRLGEPQGRSGQARKISPPPGFDPWTVQPVASRYAYAITAPIIIIIIIIILLLLLYVRAVILWSVGQWHVIQYACHQSQ